MSKPVFAFLVLEEHPYGCAMLERIVAAGHVPARIVVESSSVADEERAKFIQRIGGRKVAPALSDQARALGVPVQTVPVHDSGHVVPLLRDLDLDLLVLGGTRILRGELLRVARDGVVNSHPGLLPECRGSSSPAWSVLHDIPVGATAHLCDDGIDTGDLLLRRELPVYRGATYEDLCLGTLLLAGELMAEALVAYDEGRWPELRRPQGSSSWPTFRNAPEEVLEQVRAKLAAETYAHYVDRPASGGSQPSMGSSTA